MKDRLLCEKASTCREKKCRHKYFHTEIQGYCIKSNCMGHDVECTRPAIEEADKILNKE